MPSVETRPYLSCPPEAVKPEPWMHERGGLPELLPEHLVDWDPAQNLTIRRTIVVHMDGLKSACGLGEDAEVALVVSWRSPGSGQRGIAQRRVLERKGAELACSLEAMLPGPELAGTVRIITRVVLVRPGRSDGPLAARRPGSILWEDQVALQLEGIGSRFPMEIVDFGAIGLPLAAAWRLQWTRGNLNAQAMGCLVLLLNKRHKRITLAASRNTPDPEAKAIWSAINLGVAREIILGALDDDSFHIPGQKFDDESVGSVALALIERAFPGESVRAVQERQRNSPDKFECDLQAAFHLFDPGT